MLFPKGTSLYNAPYDAGPAFASWQTMKHYHNQDKKNQKGEYAVKVKKESKDAEEDKA